jgi:hypothetical protein
MQNPRVEERLQLEQRIDEEGLKISMQAEAVSDWGRCKPRQHGPHGDVIPFAANNPCFHYN